MHPGDPANFEEYDPEEEIKPHEILIEADVQVRQRLLFSFKSALGSIWRLQILLWPTVPDEFIPLSQDYKKRVETDQ